MGIMVYSLLSVMQDFVHQPYNSAYGSLSCSECFAAQCFWWFGAWARCFSGTLLRFGFRAQKLAVSLGLAFALCLEARNPKP